jgi:PCO_ADO
MQFRIRSRASASTGVAASNSIHKRGMAMTSGISIDRRDFLFIGASGALMMGSAMGQAAPANQEDFTALMAALEELGDQLPLTTRPEQDAYIYRLAARALRVNDFPIPKMGQMGRTGVEIGPLARTTPPSDIVHGIALVSYRLAPNAVLQAHNHPNYSVATVGVEGEARVTHYEPDASAPAFTSREPFAVRRTAERLLRAHEVTTLSPARDNIHTFRAGPAGARFVDLFSNHGGDVGFSYLDIDRQPIAPGGDAFRARWTGTRPPEA